MKFTPITRRKVSDPIEDQIASAILTDQLEAGSQLPPKRTLIETFPVSRQAVRDVLHRLVGMGLLGVQQARGCLL